MTPFAHLSETDRDASYAALVDARISLTHAGEPFPYGEPEDVEITDETVMLVYAGVTYVCGRAARDLVVEMRHARCHIDCRAYTDLGRLIVSYQMPVGDPRWN
jgi:hypothetical protein